MQLCALDATGELVRATSAQRHIDYFCLECGQIVRLRKGAHRQAHYYHSQPNQVCRLSAKSLVHISVQNKIVELLPTGQAEMEFRFPSISRITDVAWIPQKIVFEVQCATISAEEVMARNASYASIGYDVIWILHSNRYNKGRVTSAEDVLNNYAHYYTDINTQGNGSIFDQYAVVEFGKRIWRFPARSIDIAKPYNHKEKQKLLKEEVPAKFLERYLHWNHGFSDDYLDAAAKMPSELSASFQKLHKETCKVDADVTLFNQVLHYIHKWIVHPYQVVFRHVLEKASR